jgi:hypothetical protein
MLKVAPKMWVSVLVVLLAIIGSLLMLQLRAQGVNGHPDLIKIVLSHSQYPYQCYASMCFKSDAEKESDIRLHEGAVRDRCSGMLADPEHCAQEQEILRAAQQCYRSLCYRARCQRIPVKGSGCAGGPYFE